MHLRELELDEFRSFRRLRLSVDRGGFRAIGPNASGKSTLLEAVAMLATTRSPRTSAEREIAHWESGVELAIPPYARARGVFDRLDGTHHIEIGLAGDDLVRGAFKKKVRFDDRPVRAVDAVGQLKSVLFSPHDVELIAGSPSIRRRYIDMATSQASRPYLRALSRYGRVLEQRNSLLRRFARENIGFESSRPGEELAFWNGELTISAAEVLAIRLGAIAFLDSRARLHYEALTGVDSLRLDYESPRTKLPEFEMSSTHWDSPSQTVRQALAASFAASLNLVGGEELRRGVTAIGPHRDDLIFTAGGADLGRFGSRGQQRLAVIAVKLGELDLLEQSAGEPPLLLLDDVLSELDALHREKIVKLLSARQAQICVTATDEVDLAAPALAHLPLIRIGSGMVQKLEPE